MRLSLIDTLLDEGLIDERQLGECRDLERSSGQPLERVLKTKGFVSEEALLEILSRTLRLLSTEASRRSIRRGSSSRRSRHSLRATTT